MMFKYWKKFKADIQILKTQNLDLRKSGSQEQRGPYIFCRYSNVLNDYAVSLLILRRCQNQKKSVSKKARKKKSGGKILLV